MSCHTFCDEAGFSLEEIRAAAAEGRLLTMEVEFSQLCNFRCPYCYLDARPHDELTSEECRDLILQGKELGVRKVIILGGEPMIYPRILEKIRFIRAQGLEVEIFTNGSNMTAENAEELAQLDVKVVLKMNTMDPAKQNLLCGIPDAHEIIQEAFKNLKAAGYGAGGKSMAVSSVISTENYDELKDLWCWLRDQQIDPYFEMITPQGSATDNDWLYLDPGKIEDLFREIAEIDRVKYQREWSVQPPLVGDICLRHQFSCYVNAFGDVMPCVGVNLPVGNIRKKRLKQILADSEVMQDLKAYTENIKGPCGRCENKESCYGCRGAAYQMTGDYLASDPLCWKNRDLQGQIETLPIEAGDLIPQQAPMRLVDQLLKVGERSAEVYSVIQAACPFLDESGRLEESAYLEIIAQAAALHNGWRNRAKQIKPEGFLLGAKKLVITGEVFAGDALVTTVFKEAKLGDFGIIRGSVWKGDQCVASGEVKVFHKESAS
jgi:radical SAM protein with 4Fe4S-binding SPASM domain